MRFFDEKDVNWLSVRKKNWCVFLFEMLMG